MMFKLKKQRVGKSSHHQYILVDVYSGQQNVTIPNAEMKQIVEDYFLMEKDVNLLEVKRDKFGRRI